MVIDSFRGEFDFLNNFHPSPIKWQFARVTFPTVEHGFVWHKSNDPRIREEIRTMSTPGRVKRFGRTLELRPDWEQVKIPVMQRLVQEKFLQNPMLREDLLRTEGAELIEGNHWGDTFWGVCDGVGENHLGIILMETRTLMRKLGL